MNLSIYTVLKILFGINYQMQIIALFHLFILKFHSFSSILKNHYFDCLQMLVELIYFKVFPPNSKKGIAQTTLKVKKIQLVAGI